jgi:hypothetical protein
VLVAVAIAGCASAAWVAAEGFETLRHGLLFNPASNA